MDDFKKLIEQAKAFILSDRLDEAEACIKASAGLNPSAPEIHNLYGVLLECRGDKLGALKHYRAATDLDPMYLPAKNNLYRTAQFEPQAISLD